MDDSKEDNNNGNGNRRSFDYDTQNTRVFAQDDTFSCVGLGCLG
jgi:hypothetical protein